MVSSENFQSQTSTVAETALTKTYSQEEVQQILHLALSRQEEGGEISHAQLAEIAQDLSISPENLRAAELEWNNRQDEFHQRQVFNTYRKNRLQQHTIKYGIVNTFLLLLDLVGGGGFSWSLYILLGWGLALALQTWKVWQTEGEDYEQAFQRWRMKKQLGQSFTTFVNKWLTPSGS